jgi:hypothetical protein
MEKQTQARAERETGRVLVGAYGSNEDRPAATEDRSPDVTSGATIRPRGSYHTPRGKPLRTDLPRGQGRDGGTFYLGKKDCAGRGWEDLARWTVRGNSVTAGQHLA